MLWKIIKYIFSAKANKKEQKSTTKSTTKFLLTWLIRGFTFLSLFSCLLQIIGYLVVAGLIALAISSGLNFLQ